eukprot:1319241-Amphidinium_carterae.2
MRMVSYAIKFNHVVVVPSYDDVLSRLTNKKFAKRFITISALLLYSSETLKVDIFCSRKASNHTVCRTSPCLVTPDTESAHVSGRTHVLNRR